MRAALRLLGWPRATRGVMLGWLVANIVAAAALDWLAYGRVRLTIDLAPRIEFSDPWWRSLALLGMGALVVVVAVARLHHVSRSGWWLLSALGLAALTLVWPAVGPLLPALWLSVTIWPGAIGPNRFGPDPRGWESQAHYDRQRAALARR